LLNASSGKVLSELRSGSTLASNYERIPSQIEEKIATTPLIRHEIIHFHVRRSKDDICCNKYRHQFSKLRFQLAFQEPRS
jgi:hypothetical protein